MLDATFSVEARASAGLGRVRYVFVDDGSTDRSAAIVAEHIRAGAPAKLYRLSRNFGHQSALSAGLDHADADFVAIMDADLQDPPQEILAMLARVRAGYDVVYGVRTKRKESLPKRIGYRAFYRLLSMLSEVDVPLDSGDFCVMRGVVVKAIRDLPEKLRFPRGLRAWVGFRQIGHEFERSSRSLGRSKYGYGRLYALATHGIASLSIRPLRITQAFSLLAFLLTGFLVLLLLYRLLFVEATSPVEIWFLFTYILIAGTTSLNLFCFYVLSAYVGRMYLEAKQRPAYIVSEIIE